MSLVQSRCRLDSPASFADPIWTRNEQQVQRHQAPEECLSPLMPTAKLYKSLLTNCGVQLRLHQRQLRKAAVGRSNMESGLWPVAPDEFESGGITRPARIAGKKFRDGQYSLASLLFAVHGALWSRRHCLWLCSGWQ